MLQAGMFSEIIQANCPPRLPIRQTLPDRLDNPGFLHQVEQLLIRRGILHHEFRLTVDRQHDRLASLPQLLKKFRRVLFKVGQ